MDNAEVDIVAIAARPVEVTATGHRMRVVGEGAPDPTTGDAPIADGFDALPQVAVPALSPAPTAREVIHAAIGRSVAHLFAGLPVARLGEDTEGVHQARVATRRLRSDLRTFSPLLDGPWSAGLRGELRWLAAELGAVRDADVLAARLRAAVEQHDEIDAVGARRVIDLLEAQQARARSTLLGHLDDERALRLVDHLIAAAADPLTAPQADDPALERLPGLVRKPWKRLRRAVDALDPEPPVARLHDVRILAKRTRYAAEAVAPAFGDDARAFAAAVTRIQDVLGELNDVQFAQTWLAGVVDRLDSAAAFAAGRLAEAFAAEGARHRHGWERAYRKASGKRVTAWFR